MTSFITTYKGQVCSKHNLHTDDSQTINNDVVDNNNE